MVGYQAVGTLGRLIQNGEPEVTIFGERIPIRAHVDTISGYSGHKGSDDLVEFVDKVSPKLHKVFCVMGELRSAMYLSQRIRDEVGVEALAPESGTSISLPVIE